MPKEVESLRRTQPSRSPVIIILIIVAVAMIASGLASWSITQQAIRKEPSSFCRNANVIIQKGEYIDATNTLKLFVYNYGSVDLTFKAIVSYKNGQHTPYPDTYPVNTGEIAQITLSGVSSELFKEATVQSQECHNVQDLLKAEYIVGF